MKKLMLIASLALLASCDPDYNCDCYVTRDYPDGSYEWKYWEYGGCDDRRAGWDYWEETCF